MAAQEYDPSSRDVMQAFYRELYPFKSVYKWLNHEHVPTRLFTHREIAYSLPGDIYIRYKSFLSAEEFKKETLGFNPERFEIGPVYSARPRDKKVMGKAPFVPEKRELVFDIDMTDYDEIRTCCKDAAICNRCWAFITAAVRVLDASLREQFGWRHLLWVYSGRRGIHCWVSDPDAMALTDDQRRAVVGWMTVVKGGKEMSKKVNVRASGHGPSGMPWPLPPAVREALEILNPVFVELVLEEQNLFEKDEHWEELLKLLPQKEKAFDDEDEDEDEDGKKKRTIVNKLRKLWNEDENRHSLLKWEDFRNEVKKTEKGSVERELLKAAMEDIVLQYTYPRIDAEVSKKRNHLLKAPFCVHPKTGRVCVPVDPANIENFNPEEVPTVSQLLTEMEANMSDAKEGQDGWEMTSLKPYVDMFEKHILGIMNEVRIKKRETADMTW